MACGSVECRIMPETPNHLRNVLKHTSTGEDKMGRYSRDNDPRFARSILWNYHRRENNIQIIKGRNDLERECVCGGGEERNGEEGASKAINHISYRQQRGPVFRCVKSAHRSRIQGPQSAASEAKTH